ncbi:MAG: polyprenol monophosphomannose synthase [Amoebophilaceae bacterium]|nr:polyprenol monophosphomannose synthase [Amoebophilaceae bacterium]
MHNGSTAIASCKGSTVLVVIPTYNEIENIEPLLRAIFDLNIGLHVLVVDDHSPDGTAQRVVALQQQYKAQLHLLNRPRKEGIGNAYLAGFSWAFAYDYGYIFSFDGDFSHHPMDLLRLLAVAMAHQADLVIGSRYIHGGKVIGWTKGRILLSYLANLLARGITCMPIKDSTAGFVCYKCLLLKEIITKNVTSRGYSFQVEMKFLAYKKKATLIEIPITFKNRVYGLSKLNCAIAWESFVDLLRMKWHSWLRK